MNLTGTLSKDFFPFEKLKALGLPVAILMLMMMMVVPLPAVLLDIFFTTNISELSFIIASAFLINPSALSATGSRKAPSGVVRPDLRAQ